MKKEETSFESMDLSRYQILSYSELLKVNGGSAGSQDDDGIAGENSSGGDNFAGYGIDESEVEIGGHEIENTNEAVAGAEAGDTLTRDDGTEVTIMQGDIDWAQDYCDTHGISYGKEEETSDEFFAPDNSSGGEESEDSGAVEIEGGEKCGGSKEGESASNENKGGLSNLRDEEQPAEKDSISGSSKCEIAVGKTVSALNTVAGYAGIAGETAHKIAGSDLSKASALNEFAERMASFGNTVVLVDFAYTAYSNGKSHADGEESCWQSAYNTVTHGISVTAGAGIGGVISGIGVAGSFGSLSVPSVVGGAVAGSAVTELCELGFDKLEEKIWGSEK